MKRSWLVSFLVALAALLSVVDVQAATPEDRTMQMTQVTAADREEIAGGPLLIAAYALAWAILFGFVLWTFLRQRRLERDLARLEGKGMGPRSPP